MILYVFQIAGMESEHQDAPAVQVDIIGSFPRSAGH